MSNKRTEDPTIITWLSDEQYIAERKAKRAEKPEGRGLALELIKQAHRSRVTAPQRIPRRGPSGPGSDVTARNIEQAIKTHVENLNIANGLDAEGMIEATRAIREAITKPVPLSPVQALAHVDRVIGRVGNAPLVTAPTTRTRGRPKIRRDRVPELQRVYGAALKAQVERGLEAMPKREAARLKRRAAGDPIREAIRRGVAILIDAQVPVRKWVAALMQEPGISRNERHIRRVLSELGYRVPTPKKKKRINASIGPRKPKHRKRKRKT